MKKRTLRPDERQIWRKVTETVKPIRPHDSDSGENFGELIDPPAVTGTGRSRSTVKAAPATPRSPAPPQDRSAERRLRRGRVAIDARIDLHGMTQDAARTALGHFLHGARSRGFRCVLVITGKGKTSARERAPGEALPGVIKRRFPEWLSEPELRHLVSGYSPAHRRHGGDGAYYVMIRSGLRE
ncbi:Smr/MutS family protein [Hyphobacterium sp. HN65]|uniref:Smr/MutS family protein n=1 Tax=Hyphobacterium lacteum TaxID=3116575 RepID=A0ABU7LRU5_9PROT|nr:Smr/MutS family protein [Hyphobacterium sp. HN65]MEE2526638.1 Smr/MutS family protein [Hyphobacterium sp. HN65]